MKDVLGAPLSRLICALCREFHKALAGRRHCLRPPELEECVCRYQIIPPEVSTVCSGCVPIEAWARGSDTRARAMARI